MPKAMVGEATAMIIAGVIRENPGLTPHDVAMTANDVLREHPKLRANLSSTTVNSFISYHPLGQELNQKRLIAAQRGRKLPAWADERTALADSTLQKSGELVVLNSFTGLAHIDEGFEHSVYIMRDLARRLPPSRQNDVVTVVHTLSVAAGTIAEQQRVIDAKISEVGMARQLIDART